ncbi:MAG: polysaccharide pyruvyl transferase family protein [Gammaproteobacteria bacterium]|nr:polysaccharide pyruvyl transferase family protein [Gammaproteobacteria bacterium]
MNNPPSALQELRIAIYGSFGYRDIGDEAMLTADLDFITGELGIPRTNITLIGGDPQYIAYYHDHPLERCAESPDSAGVKAMVRELIDGKSAASHVRRQRRLRKIADQHDVLLISGGGTINTRNPNGSSIKRMARLVDLFAGRGVPVFMSGQTIGPLGLVPAHDRLARMTLQKVDWLTVRDCGYSKRYIDMIAASIRNFLETGDDAFYLPFEEASLPEEVEAWLADRSIVTMNITDYTSDTPEKKAYFASIVEHVVRTYDLDVVLVPHSGRDYAVLWQIFDMLDNAFKRHVLLPDTRMWHASMIKQLISRSELAIGGRYHFVVFAGTSNTPFIGMSGNHYSYIKQDGFARQLGLERYILTERETWDAACLHERIGAARDERLSITDGSVGVTESMRTFGDWLAYQVLSDRRSTTGSH